MLIAKTHKVQEIDQSNRQHFHSFDALRFFSFLLVFLQHLPIPEISVFSFFSKSGKVGVSFFFVLSGFLITYILLHEKITTNSISLRKFFIRRILRIWPLFYLMLLFAFVTPYLLQILNIIFSNEGYQPNWLISILFLENYKMMFTDSFPNVSPLRVMWSLCVEEHFYILWGLLFAILPVKRIPNLIFVSILIASLARIIYINSNIQQLDLLTNLDYFAFGAIPAYILLLKSEFLIRFEKIKLIFKYMFVFSTLLLAFLLPNVNSALFNYIAPTIYGISFSALILCTLPQKNGIKISDKLWVSKLGIYTYGLYLTHTILINLLLKYYSNKYDFEWVIFGIGSLILTIVVSILSFHFFEKQFLKFKKLFL